MKVALVTGAGNGIGSAVAHTLSGRGFHVVSFDVEAGGWAGEWYAVDLADTSATLAAFEAFISKHGRIDALINNAATAFYNSIEATDLAVWDHVFAVNVRAAFVLTKAAKGYLAVNGGCIVNVSSVHAMATSRNVAAYAAAKAALVGFTRAAAVELAPSGIRVNAVLPGATDTAMLRAGLVRDLQDVTGPEEAFTKLESRHPVGRIGMPQEIAECIAFLASEHASFVTGSCLVVDGGAIARLSTE